VQRCAVLYSKDGFSIPYAIKKQTRGVACGCGIIAAAPTRFLVAGWATRCRHGSKPGLRAYQSQTSVADIAQRWTPIAKLCYETLLAYGVAAKVASERHIVTPALDHIVEANILLSGLGFESAGLAAAIPFKMV